jgi:hypothetical protein
MRCVPDSVAAAENTEDIDWRRHKRCKCGKAIGGALLEI